VRCQTSTFFAHAGFFGLLEETSGKKQRFSKHFLRVTLLDLKGQGRESKVAMLEKQGVE
jgi:hypothetical protein